MKKCVFFLITLTFLKITNSLLAQGTAFTYQGQLQSNGSPANGNYDFTFALFNNSSTNTGQVGNTVTNFDVGVTNALFTVTLDFGSVFTGNPTWLSIGVRANGGGSFTALNPLQELTPTPYAIYTPNAGAAASANSVAGSNIVGTITAGQLPASLVTNGESGVNFTGTFLGDGSGLTNVPTTSYEANLVIVRGTLDSTGAIVLGQGFSVTVNSSTTRTITFDTPFSDNPTVALGQHGSSGNSIVDLVTSSADSFSTVANGSAGFEFIAIGPR